MSFHCSSAELSIPRGAGCVVARMYIVCALGRDGGNCKGRVNGVGFERNACVIGPQRPCGSNANGMRIVFLLSKSFMTVSPGIVWWELICTLSRMNFFFSAICRCRSAMAVNCCLTSADSGGVECSWL